MAHTKNTYRAVDVCTHCQPLEEAVDIRHSSAARQFSKYLANGIDGKFNHLMGNNDNVCHIPSRGNSHTLKASLHLNCRPSSPNSMPRVLSIATAAQTPMHKCILIHSHCVVGWREFAIRTQGTLGAPNPCLPLPHWKNAAAAIR